VDGQFNGTISGQELPPDSVRQLLESGFVIIPGPVSGTGLANLCADYDQAMAQSSGLDYKAGSTTTRLFDLVNRGAAFDQVYVFPPLLSACQHVIGEPFKLSSLLARTVRPRTPAQDLHADLSRDSDDAPIVGFILMVDPFQEDNGATRFAPASQKWIDVPSDRSSNLCADWEGQSLACGDAGSIIIFNGAIWHGHTANLTVRPRRSIQGYFVRRSAQSGLNFSERMLPETLKRISPLARYLLAV
jgi:hypothetical protein